MILGNYATKLLAGGRIECARQSSSLTQSIKGLRSFTQLARSQNPLLHHRWRARQCLRSQSQIANDVHLHGGDADGDDANRIDGGAG